MKTEKDLVSIPFHLVNNENVGDGFACRVGNSVADVKDRAELVCDKGTIGTIFAGKNTDKMKIYAFVIGDYQRFREKNSTFKWTFVEEYVIQTVTPKEKPLVMRK